MMKSQRKNSAFNIVLSLIFLLALFITLFPFWNLLVVSLNDPADSLKGGLYFYPRIFTWVNYKVIFFDNERLIQGFINSILRTGIGTVLNVFCSSLIAYALVCRHYVLRKFMSKYVVLTMYVSAGLIPTFMLYKSLGLLENFAVYLAPHLISAYNIILLRTYMQDISPSLIEAAKIDGATDAGVFFKVILPLALPVLATVALFIAVFQWSMWQDTYFYASNVSRNGLTTLQYEMMILVTSANSNLSDTDISNIGGGASKPTSQSLQAAMTIVATVPILIVYPFLQRYFVNGISMGAVKE